MAANLSVLFKFFIILLLLICLFFIIRQVKKRSLRGVITSIILFLVLVIMFFIPNYMKSLPIQGKEIAHHSSLYCKTLVVATEGSYFPWNYVSSNGKPNGFDVDVAKEVAKRLGMEAKFVIIPFENMVTNLANRQFDMVVAAMSITPERKNSIAFSNPYAQSKVTFFGKKDKYLKLKDADIKTLKKYLKGKTVGTQMGTTWPNYLNNEFKNILNVKYYNSQPQLMMEVKSGRVDLGFSEIPSVKKFIKSYPNIIMFGPTLGIEDSSLFGEGIAIALAKCNIHLLNKVNVVLESMHEDGTLKELSIKHFGLDLSYKGNNTSE